MKKILLISFALFLLPSSGLAAEENPIEQKTLLQKVSELQVFKLRLPYSIQRAVQKEQAEQNAIAVSPDSCQGQARPHQKGADLDYSCDTHKALKKELSAVAAN